MSRHMHQAGTALIAFLIPIVAAAADPFAIDLAELRRAGPAPDTVIDSSNVGDYSNLLDPEVARLISAGDFDITVGEPVSFDTHPAFAAATVADATSLGAEPGDLLGYEGGLPFPAPPQTEDTQAGDKLAWNMRYAWSGDNGILSDMIWHYRDMHRDKIEREVRFKASMMRFMHRHVTTPVPEIPNNPGGVFFGLYLRATYPPDVKNTQLLIHRLEDDKRQEQGWMYVPFQRRVRRLATGQKTDAFLGSDIMIEDFLGYNGRIKDMSWRYAGSKLALMPMYRHNEQRELVPSQDDEFSFVSYGGAGGCFPQVRWQLRPVHMLEGSPHDSGHPLSKRFFYIDSQTYAAPLGLIYDRAGELWKLGVSGFSHPDHHAPENAGSGAPIFDGASMIDLQARHCTTLTVRARVNVDGLRATNFQPGALRARGR
ncbi:MAG: DUF1329 domain-containing protein [Chromatiales bacterium]|nr:DUF1329 domain-containing protein [Chromatiales bacterium]